MLRQDGGVHVGHEGGVGGLQSDLHGVVVHLLQAGNLGGGASLDLGSAYNVHDPAFVAAYIVRVSQAGQGEDHIVSGEGLAVVPLYILAQVEGVDGAVIGDVPALSQIGLVVQRSIGLDQEAVDQVLHVAVRGPGILHGVQVGNLGGLADDDVTVIIGSYRGAVSCASASGGCGSGAAASAGSHGKDHGQSQEE